MIIESRSHQELIDITDLINEEIRKSGVSEGLINIFIPHATAALIINENDDPNVCVDFLKKVDDLIPLHDNYLHDRVDNNAAAHIKASFFRPEFTLQIRNGTLLLGTWQQLMLAEFDGPKTRRIEIMIRK
ncbi:MAG: secondary thiamine-phosphate synthase enzyme YjbQ [Nanoarchaeota archaeon]|nr:secondary thiamine-phosphate synthase enzyme YjbQ [Nanoarchaeota archaeon]